MAENNHKEVAVRARDIHKEFILPQSKSSSFKQTVVNIVKKNNKVTQKVLNGVSFEVNKGDFFGIVGRNGSGKSTLLKLLAGVYAPTAGSVELNGKLTPFIELGVGFNPELSGRDNVFLNGALLGFNRKQMEEMYDDIVAFAELEPFMGQKLKNYSSGMQVRLAFSIAIKAKNDILIFDEVLAVGDEAFQRKCLDVFERYKAEGQTVILVTHDMETVRDYCNRAILISNGDLIIDGDPQRVADEYSRLNQEQIDAEVSEQAQKDAGSIKVQLSNESGQPAVSFGVGEQIGVDISWDKEKRADVVMLDLYKNSGEHITNLKSSRGSHQLASLKETSSAAVQMKAMLLPGKYHFIASLRTEDDEEIETVYDVGEFTIKEEWRRVAPDTWSGLTYLDHAWKER